MNIIAAVDYMVIGLIFVLNCLILGVKGFNLLSCR